MKGEIARRVGSRHRGMLVLGGIVLLFAACTDPADIALAQQIVGTWTMSAPSMYSGCELDMDTSRFVLTAADLTWGVEGSWNVRGMDIYFRPTSLVVAGEEQSDQTLSIMMAAGVIPMFLANRADYQTSYTLESDTMVIAVTYETYDWEYGLGR